MPRSRTPDLAKRHARPAGLATAARHDPGMASAPARGRGKAIPLASLPLPQRRLISALLEAARAAAIRRADPADTNLVAPREIPRRRAGGAR